MRAEFSRKEPEVRASEFQVNKIICLPSDEYAHFTRNLLKDYDFIAENADLMGVEHGVWQCILVTGEGMNEGVLVESEGASYARYSAFVPSVKEIISQYQEMKAEQKAEIQTEESVPQMKM